LPVGHSGNRLRVLADAAEKLLTGYKPWVPYCPTTCAPGAFNGAAC